MMLSNIGVAALVLLSGVSSVAGDALATIKPCPSCPKTLSMAPITVTEQYQPVSTCVPEQTCHKKKCHQTASCSTYDFVSTHLPCNDGTSTTLITKTDQYLKLAHVSTVLTTYLPCPTHARYGNATAYEIACTSTKYQTMEVDYSAPYNSCGPMALPPWEGSGLCGDTCGKNPDEEKDQPVHVRKCLDGVCSTYAETWVSVKPTTASSSSVVPYSTSAYCAESGLNTIPVTATVTPYAGGDFTAACIQTFTITTSVASPGPIQITKTITVTFTKTPEPTVSYSSRVATLSTTTYCSNGVHTIPIATTCKPSGPDFTNPATTTVYYTTTVTDGPKTVDCTQTVTLTFTSTIIVYPQTVISGQTQYPTTAPPSVSASTTSSGDQTSSSGGVTTSSFPGSSSPASSLSTAESTTSSSTTSTGTPGTVTTSTGTTSTVTVTSSSSFSSTPSPTAPAEVNGFEFFGCLGSTNGFPTFNLLESSSSNSVELCTSECSAAGFPYAGLYTTDCYCAASIDAGTSGDATNGVCNLPCPGNPLQTCGGNVLVTRKRAAPNTIVLDVYEGTPTSTSSSSTSEATSDPSSDPDPAAVPRGIDADLEVAAPRAQEIRVRRGGLLRNPKVQQGRAVAKRNFGLKQPFGQ